MIEIHPLQKPFSPDSPIRPASSHPTPLVSSSLRKDSYHETLWNCFFVWVSTSPMGLPPSNFTYVTVTWNTLRPHRINSSDSHIPILVPPYVTVTWKTLRRHRLQVR